MSADKRFSGKVCIVTGVASGIGEAAALIFAREGARVVVADVQAEKGQSVADRITAEGGVATFYPMDVARADHWAGTIDHTVGTHLRLDVLVNNAGMGYMKPIMALSLDEWRQVMATNLESVFLGIRHAVPAMEKNGARGGSIVNVSSNLVMKPKGDMAAYCASKSGVNLLTKVAAIELGEKNIRVNTVFPGATETLIWDGLKQQLQMTQEAFRKASASMTLLGGMAGAGDVAGGIAYLASDAARFVTGSELVVDGGEVLSRGDLKFVEELSRAAGVLCDAAPDAGEKRMRLRGKGENG